MLWFLEGNPVVDYSKIKDCIRLMFWNGADFEEELLKTGTGKFKNASIRYSNVDQINAANLEHWLEKTSKIQGDYKNIERKEQLKRI